MTFGSSKDLYSFFSKSLLKCFEMARNSQVKRGLFLDKQSVLFDNYAVTEPWTMAFIWKFDAALQKHFHFFL